MTTSGPAPSVMGEHLSDAEQKMLTAAISGTLIDLHTGDASDDDPARGGNWDASRQIRATLLAELLTGTRHLDGKPPSCHPHLPAAASGLPHRRTG
jgi:hypothetical protein